MGGVNEAVDDDMTIIRGQGVLRVSGDNGGSGHTGHIRQTCGPLYPGEVTIRIAGKLKSGSSSVRFPEHPWHGPVLVLAPEMECIK